MVHYYEHVDSGGWSRAEKKLFVYLYPNSPDEVSACRSGGIAADAVTNAAEQLYDAGVIGSYSIDRFPAEESGYSYPRLDMDSYESWEHSAVGDDFRAYVSDSDKNGADNLYDFVGVHQLIHGGSNGCNDMGKYPSSGAGTEGEGNTAFAEGRVSWSPVCSDRRLTKNAAIQEMTHLCMEGGHDEEHYRGTIQAERCGQYSTCYNVTPMLTYHWDESGIDNYGECPTDSDSHDSYSQSLTECTKDAVEDAANKYA